MIRNLSKTTFDYSVPKKLIHTGNIYLDNYENDFIADNLLTSDNIDLHNYKYMMDAPNLITIRNINLNGYGYDFVTLKLITTGNIFLRGYKHEFVAPNLVKTGYIYADTFMGHDIQIYDGIPCIVEAIEVINDIQIIEAKLSRILNGKFAEESVFFITKGYIHSHGETKQDAINNFVYKIGSNNLPDDFKIFFTK